MLSQLRHILGATVVATLISSSVSATVLYSIDKDDSLLRVIDPATGATIGSPLDITLAGETVDGGTGLATHPTTGALFALLKLDGQSGRELVTLDPTTAGVTATSIGDTGDKFAAITFGTTAALYGVIGDKFSFRDLSSETLHMLSQTDGLPTLLGGLGAGDDGEAIAYNPTDGKIYHASGNDALNALNSDGEEGRILERLAPTEVITRETLSGFDHNEILALTDNGTSFLAADLSDDFLSITDTGAVTDLGDLDHAAKGLAFKGGTLFSVAKGDDVLREIDPADGTTDATTTITLAGETVDGATGLATHPTTGDLYALLKLAGQDGRELVTIDTTTGIATSIGDTGDKFAGLAFKADGTLYAVTGDGADATTEALFTLDLTDATPALVAYLGSGDDGEAIAFNPTDGEIYHASGNSDLNDPIDGRIFEHFDPDALPEPVELSGDEMDEVLALVFSSSFLVADLRGELFSLTDGGVATSLGFLDHDSKGLAFADAPTASAVPEPGTLALFAIGLVGLGIARRRKAV